MATTQVTQLTDAQMLARTRLLLDQKTATLSSWTDPDLYDHLTRSSLFHWRMMLRKNENWSLSTQAYATTAGTSDYALPTDFFQVIRMWRMQDDDTTKKNYLIYPIQPKNETEGRGYYLLPTDGNVRFIYFDEIPAGDNYELEYVSHINKIDGADSGANKTVSAPAALEDVVVTYACRLALLSKGDDAALRTFNDQYKYELKEFKNDIAALAPYERKYIDMEWGQHDWTTTNYNNILKGR